MGARKAVAVVAALVPLVLGCRSRHSALTSASASTSPATSGATENCYAAMALTERRPEGWVVAGTMVVTSRGGHAVSVELRDAAGRVVESGALAKESDLLSKPCKVGGVLLFAERPPAADGASTLVLLRPSVEDPSADVVSLCTKPEGLPLGDDGGFHWAFARDTYAERLTSTRWRKWLFELDEDLRRDKPTAERAKRQKGDELEAAAKPPGAGIVVLDAPLSLDPWGRESSSASGQDLGLSRRSRGTAFPRTGVHGARRTSGNSTTPPRAHVVLDAPPMKTFLGMTTLAVVAGLGVGGCGSDMPDPDISGVEARFAQPDGTLSSGNAARVVGSSGEGDRAAGFNLTGQGIPSGSGTTTTKSGQVTFKSFGSGAGSSSFVCSDLMSGDEDGSCDCPGGGSFDYEVDRDSSAGSALVRIRMNACSIGDVALSGHQYMNLSMRPSLSMLYIVNATATVRGETMKLDLQMRHANGTSEIAVRVDDGWVIVTARKSADGNTIVVRAKNGTWTCKSGSDQKGSCTNERGEKYDF